MVSRIARVADGIGGGRMAKRRAERVVCSGNIQPRPLPYGRGADWRCDNCGRAVVVAGSLRDPNVPVTE